VIDILDHSGQLCGQLCIRCARIELRIGFVQRGRDAGGGLCGQSFAADELINIGFGDNRNSGPCDRKLLLRVKGVALVGQRGGGDFILGQMLTRREGEDVQTARDLCAVNLAIINVAECQ